jgi:hypothetical protein
MWCARVLQYKTPEVASRCSNLIRVNIYKDKIKNAGSLPTLPNAAALVAALAPSYWTLNCVGRDKACGRPVYAITDQQQQAAETFLKVCPVCMLHNIIIIIIIIINITITLYNILVIMMQITILAPVRGIMCTFLLGMQTLGMIIFCI